MKDRDGEKTNGDIRGLYVAQNKLGMEFPVYKDFYIIVYNAYSAGLSSKYGRLQKQMKYFNCLDINLYATLCYRFTPNDKTINK